MDQEPVPQYESKNRHDPTAFEAIRAKLRLIEDVAVLTYITSPDELRRILEKMQEFVDDDEWQTLKIGPDDRRGCRDDGDCGSGAKCVRGECVWDP